MSLAFLCYFSSRRCSFLSSLLFLCLCGCVIVERKKESGWWQEGREQCCFTRTYFVPSVASSLPFSSSSLFLILYILLSSSLFCTLSVFFAEGRKTQRLMAGNEGKRVVLMILICTIPAIRRFFLSFFRCLFLFLRVFSFASSLSVFDGGGREEGGWWQEEREQSFVSSSIRRSSLLSLFFSMNGREKWLAAGKRRELLLLFVWLSIRLLLLLSVFLSFSSLCFVPSSPSLFVWKKKRERLMAGRKEAIKRNVVCTVYVLPSVATSSLSSLFRFLTISLCVFAH